MICTYKIEEDVVNLLERLNYEFNTRVSISAHLIETHAADSNGSFLDSAIFKKYQDDTVAANVAYDAAKREFEQSFQSRGIPGGSWSLDFNTRILTVTTLDNNQCTCCHTDKVDD